MGAKDKGGAKNSKKPARQALKERRKAKKAKARTSSSITGGR
jgi:hypothetical protein